MSKPSISKHLSILEGAGLIRGEKRGQFIHYALVRENLVNTLNGFVQEVCLVSRPLAADGDDPAAGTVRWASVKSIWIGSMTLAALILGPLTFTWSAFALFVGTT